MKKNTDMSKNDKGRRKRKRIKRQHRPKNFLDCKSLMHVTGFPPRQELLSTDVASDVTKEIFLDRFVKEVVKPFQPRNHIRNNNRNNNNNNNSRYGPSNDFTTVLANGKLIKKKLFKTKLKHINNSNNNHNQFPAKSLTDTETFDDNKLRKMKRVWKELVVIGSNQCSRVLEAADANDDTNRNTVPSSSSFSPSLIILARDMHPPTMCCAIPVLAQRLRIPLLLLPGKASFDLGRVLNVKRTSIIVLLSGDKKIKDNEPQNCANQTVKNIDGNENMEIQNARVAIDSFVTFIKDQMAITTTKELL